MEDQNSHSNPVSFDKSVPHITYVAHENYLLKNFAKPCKKNSLPDSVFQYFSDCLITMSMTLLSYGFKLSNINTTYLKSGLHEHGTCNSYC